MARTQFKIDPDRVERAWKDAGYLSLKDVFRDGTENENAVMRYDSAQKKINSGSVSYAIMDFLSKKLNRPYEYLSGDLTDRDIEDWGIPDPLFTQYQDFLNMTEEEREKYYLNLVLDMGIAQKWRSMNNRQRANCHIAMKEFINWLLDYVQPDDNAYQEIFDFFSNTGVRMEQHPEYRQKLFKTMVNNYKVSIKMYK